MLGTVKLIAEPWDTGPDGYQVGSFPPGWAEWNDQYRDTVRSYWKGDAGTLPALASRLLGSAEVFERRGRRPWASVNFVTAHDGFTLKDTVSYNDKHNEANGEDNRDGHSDNRSWNCGVEGPTDDEEVLDLRDCMRRAMMATLMLSQGTPMLLMGDEVGRSQGGNNNAYCQDNAMNWLELEGLDPRDAAFLDFMRRLIAFRAARPLFRQPSFLRTRASMSDQVEVAWLRPDGTAMEEADWHNSEARALGMLLRNTAGQALLLFNGHFEAVPFELPGSEWEIVLDTSTGQVGRGKARPPEAVPARALVVLEAQAQ